MNAIKLKDTKMTLFTHVVLELDLKKKELLHFFLAWPPAITTLKVLVHTLVGTDKSKAILFHPLALTSFIPIVVCLSSPVSELGVSLKNAQQ